MTTQSVAYRRVRISDESDDIDKCYALLLDIARNPAASDSIKEFVFIVPRPAQTLSTVLDALAKSNHSHIYTDPSEELLVRRMVRPLALRDQEDAWVRLLSDSSIRHHHNAANLRAHHLGIVLLFACARVEKLLYSYCWGSPSAGILRRNNYDRLPVRHLQHLRKVEFLPDDPTMADGRDYDELDPLATMQLFHRLPALETISMTGVSPNNDVGFRESFAPGVSTVKNLVIEHVDFSSNLTGHLIRMPKTLLELVLGEGGRSTLDGGTYPRFLKTLVKALACHKRTLRKLDLQLEPTQWQTGLRTDVADEEEDMPEEDEEESADVSSDAEHKEDGCGGRTYKQQDLDESSGPLHTWQIENDRQLRGTIGKLDDYSELTHLSVPVNLLLGLPGHEPHLRLADMLPSTLQFLLLRGYEQGAEPSYDVAVNDFLANKASLFPRLRDVFGVYEYIPCDENISNADAAMELLWVRDEQEYTWLEGDESKSWSHGIE